MNKSEWIEHIRRHLAVASVGNSTLMSQAGQGRVERAQQFLIQQVQLNSLANIDNAKFNKYLSAKTRSLANQLLRPTDNTPNWGAARKVINIFLRLCSMNKDLNPHFQLSNIEPYLELPLDNQIVSRIDEEAKTNFRKSFKIRELKATENEKIQCVASGIAKKKGLLRYELDVLFWNSGRMNA